MNKIRLIIWREFITRVRKPSFLIMTVLGPLLITAAILLMAYLGTQAPSPVGERVSQVGTLFYFGFFLLMPWWTRLGTPKPVPDRVTFKPH